MFRNTTIIINSIGIMVKYSQSKLNENQNMEPPHECNANYKIKTLECQLEELHLAIYSIAYKCLKTYKGFKGIYHKDENLETHCRCIHKLAIFFRLPHKIQLASQHYDVVHNLIPQLLSKILYHLEYWPIYTA